jgi:hypothetical protein
VPVSSRSNTIADVLENKTQTNSMKTAAPQSPPPFSWHDFFSFYPSFKYMCLLSKINHLFLMRLKFNNIKNESGSNGFVLTIKQWIEKDKLSGNYRQTRAIQQRPIRSQRHCF